MTAHRVTARNDAEQSENKIHDDAVARQYGFRGGLVPGVTVYGYLTWAPASTWGEVWLERGALEARFVKPVYAGDDVDVRAEPSDDGRLALTATNQGGEICAVGSAWLPEAAAIVSVPFERVPLPAPDARPPAGEDTLAAGTPLGTVDRTWLAEDRAEYLDRLGDDLDLYDRLGVAHPGGLIRAANEVLARTVRLGPWIHVSSASTHHGLVPDGAIVTTYAVVTDRYERKEHRFVDLDVVSVVDGRPVLSVQHTAIYQPRPG